MQDFLFRYVCLCGMFILSFLPKGSHDSASIEQCLYKCFPKNMTPQFDFFSVCMFGHFGVFSCGNSRAYLK